MTGVAAGAGKRLGCSGGTRGSAGAAVVVGISFGDAISTGIIGDGLAGFIENAGRGGLVGCEIRCGSKRLIRDYCFSGRRSGRALTVIEFIFLCELPAWAVPIRAVEVVDLRGG